jgi:hypothetical protein
MHGSSSAARCRCAASLVLAPLLLELALPLEPAPLAPEAASPEVPIGNP